MTNELRAFIFDLDGVIVDTARYHFQAWRDLARSLGFDLTDEQNELFKGVSRMKCVDILLELGGLTADEAEKHRLAERKNADYVRLIGGMDRSEILPGAEAFLEASRERGFRIAIGSASKNTMGILTSIGLASVFDAIVDGTKVSKAKPDPEVFLRAAEELGVEPARCAVFEDAIAGIEAARRAGMRSIGVGKPEVLTEAEIVIPGFEGLAPETVLGMLAGVRA
jgi:beta-phosphoglucomutase